MSETSNRKKVDRLLNALDSFAELVGQGKKPSNEEMAVAQAEKKTIDQKLDDLADNYELSALRKISEAVNVIVYGRPRNSPAILQEAKDLLAVLPLKRRKIPREDARA